MLPANQAQDLLNVDIMPGGKSFKKRDGYGLQFTLAITTSATHGAYNFFDASGNSVDLFFHDRYIQASVNGAALTTLMSTSTLAATWQCVDSLGFAYCASTGRDFILKTNGVTYATLSGSTPGTLIAVTPERLIIGGANGTAQRLSFSKANDYTTWTVGGAATDPFTLDINAPGSRITHVTYAFNKIIWFKDASFGAILGTDNTNWQVITISPNLGTLDNTSVYRDGLLYFRGQDGHIYVFDGSSATKLTRDLGATISASSGRRSNSWTQTTQADFQTGASSPTASLSFTSSPGDVLLSTNTSAINNSDFEDGGFTKNEVSYWTTSGDFNTSTLYWVKADPTAAVCGGSARTPFRGSNILQATAIGVHSASTMTVELITVSSVAVVISTIPTSTSCTWSTTTITAPSYSNQTMMVRLRIALPTSSSYLVSNQFTFPGALKVRYSPAFSGSAGSWYIDTFETPATTATYISAVKNAPNLTAWDTFTASKVDNGGAHTFYMRGSSNSFTVNSSTPTWTAQTPGTLVAIATYTYFQVRDDFSIDSTTQTPTLSDFLVNWYEGAASDKAYATYHEDAIWWAITSGAGQTVNNRILRYDLINSAAGPPVWTIYDIGTNGLIVRNNSLYFGSASTGYIYKFGDATSDNSAAINAYWKSKDFFGDSPFTEKEFRSLSISAASISNSTCTVTYTINGTSSTAYGISLYDSASSFIKHNKNLPLGRNGSYLNVKIASNAADRPLEVFGIQFTFEPKPWRPTP